MNSMNSMNSFLQLAGKIKSINQSIYILVKTNYSSIHLFILFYLSNNIFLTLNYNPILK